MTRHLFRAGPGFKAAERGRSVGMGEVRVGTASWTDRTLIDSGWYGDGRLKMLCGGENLPGKLAADRKAERLVAHLKRKLSTNRERAKSSSKA